MIGLTLLVLSFTLWLGLYLLQRDSDLKALRWVAVGLLAYTTLLLVDSVLQAVSAEWATTISWVVLPLFLLPLLCWLWALRLLLPRFRTRSQTEPQFPYALALVATLFFTLGIGILLFPLAWLPRPLVMAALGGDLLLFGVAVALLDAFDEGEALRPDMARSFVSALLAALLFGAQVALVMLVTDSADTSLLLLLLAVVLSAVALATLSGPLQAGIDKLIFADAPQLRQERAILRETEHYLPRARPEPLALEWDDAEFARLTRRALSHMGNLPRLAASPLIRLPLIDQRFQARDVDGTDNTLLRSAELKAILTEAIGRLKPPGDIAFEPTDAWRLYNALYFPYVRGLKPYSRRAVTEHLDSAESAALDWFRTYVPERTLYNWQKAAATLIAQDLREQIAAFPAQSP